MHLVNPVKGKWLAYGDRREEGGRLYVCVCGGIERRVLIIRGITFVIANEKINYESIRSSLGYPEL